MILYFGTAREMAGVEADCIDAPAGTSQDDVWSRIIHLHPRLAEIRRYCRMSADMTYLQSNDNVPVQAEEIAIIPPVSGG